MTIDLEMVKQSLMVADDSITNLTEVRDDLRQEYARLAGGLPITPRECLAALRKHAMREVLQGRDVDYVVDGDFTRARWSRSDVCWLVSRNRWERKTATNEVIAEIETASMFAENVGGES